MHRACLTERRGADGSLTGAADRRTLLALSIKGEVMTTAITSHSSRTLAARLRYLPIGVGACLLHAAILIPGYHEGGSFDSGAWFGMLGVALVLTAVVFVLAVPGGGPVTALVLAGLSVLATVAFWTFFAIPLAVAAAIVGLRARAEPAARTKGTVAVGLAALAVVATVAITIGDALAN